MNKTQLKTGLRLHWLSWLTLLLLSACMTVIVIPGAVVPSSVDVLASHWQLPATSKLRSGSMLSHGWPCEYMQSDLHSFDPTSDVIAWTSRDAWALGNKVFSFELKSLMIDLLVAVMIVAIGTLAVEFWRRRRKGAWFSLLDMFVGIAVFAIVVSWYHSHASDSAAEFDALKGTVYDGKPLPYFFSVRRRHQAPDWLTRLVGGEKQVPFCEHVTDVSLSSMSRYSEEVHSDGERSRQLRTLVRELTGFKRAEAVLLCGPAVLLPELPNAVTGLKWLDKLIVDYDDFHMRIIHPMYSSQPVTAMSRVSDITVNNRFNGIRYDDALRELIQQKVGSLETLQKLDQIDQLTTLEVNLGYISHVGWRAIPPLSKLSKISFASREIFIEDLVVLEQFTNLKQVWLSISATKEELENFQRTHPQLELKWDSKSEITAEQVVSRRLKNLRLEEWYAKKSPNFYLPLAEKLDPRNLDLTEFTLTKERLEVVNANVDLASISSISVNRIDSVDTLNQFVKRCSGLKKIELHSEFPTEVIDQLILPKQVRLLTCRQGDLTVEDLHVLIKKHQLSELDVYDSKLSDVDIAALEKAWPDIFISNYEEVPLEFQPETEPRSWPGSGWGGGSDLSVGLNAPALTTLNLSI